MKSFLVHYAKGLVGQYYQTAGNTAIALYLAGAPSVPSDKTAIAQLIASAGFDLIVPDYYGYARSAGYFHPQNCIQTAYDTLQSFKQHVPFIDVYGQYDILPPDYKEFVIIGSSYGGWISASLPRYEESFKEVVLINPYLESGTVTNENYDEETDEDFMRQLTLGYKALYRFADGYDFSKAMLEFDPLFSLNNLDHLKSTKVFVGHGSADNVVWCGRSAQFITTLKTLYPQGEHQYAEYYGLGHGGLTTQATITGRLHWRKTLQSFTH